MAGGFRPGGGRPKGSRTRRAWAKVQAPEDYMPELGEGETPLAYMLRVIRDEAVDPVRRDRMAIAAAPY
jgi:hypothetical protein